MPLLRTRPSVRLRAPRDVVPGERFELTVLLDAKEPVEIEWCDVLLSGHELVGESRRPVMATLAARVSELRTLPVGTTTLPCSVTLPPDVPPSHPGPGGRVVYEVAVHASVPWWPDARAQFALHVVRPATEPVEGRARVALSSPEPIAGVPYAELSIACDVAEPGGVIGGSVAMRELSTGRALVSLVAYQTSSGWPPQRVAAWTIPIAFEDGADATRFAFRVPDDATPSMKAPSFALEYWLVAEVRGALRTLVTASVPLHIVERGRARSGGRLVAPHVGDARLAELFEAVAEATGARVEPGPTLVIEHGGATARATRELGRRGTRLAVRVTYPPLHLDLLVREPAVPLIARGSRRTARRAGLSDRCVVSARDHEQARVLLGRLGPGLHRARGIEMSDTQLAYAVGSAANDRDSVARVASQMRGVVEAIAIAPPLPTPLETASSAWHELARTLGGELETGHARIVATTLDATVEIETLFDEHGAPCGTEVLTRPSRELRLEQPITLPSDALPRTLGLSPEAHLALDRLARFGRVRVDEREIRVSMDVPLGPAVPPARAREIVEASLRLAAALRPTTGPFR